MTGDRVADPAGLRVGDHVRVASLTVRKPKNRPRPAVGTGRIREIAATGVIVDLDKPVNGQTWCTASYSELTVIP